MVVGAQEGSRSRSDNAHVGNLQISGLLVVKLPWKGSKDVYLRGSYEVHGWAWRMALRGMNRKEKKTHSMQEQSSLKICFV